MDIISADAYLQNQPQRGERFTVRLSQQDPRDFVLYRLEKAYVSGKFPLISPLYKKSMFANILDESSGYSVSHFHQKNGYVAFEPEEVYEHCAFLCHPWNGNYFHWMLEALPQFFLFESIGFDGKYIIPRSGPFIKESLALLGISADRLIEYTVPFVVKNIYLCEKFDHTKLYEFTSVLDQLRNTFLERVSVAKRSPFPTRLYISRRHTRKIVNEKELLVHLEPYGFRMIHMEDMCLAEQITVASEADTLFGPHGAGFVCSLFMRPRSIVVEFFSNLYINPCFLHIAQHLKHKYIPIPEYLNTEKVHMDMTSHLPFVTTVLQGHFGVL